MTPKVASGPIPNKEVRQAQMYIYLWERGMLLKTLARALLPEMALLGL